MRNLPESGSAWTIVVEPPPSRFSASLARRSSITDWASARPRHAQTTVVEYDPEALRFFSSCRILRTLRYLRPSASGIFARDLNSQSDAPATVRASVRLETPAVM